jgi:D-glycero-D-manno-heptose 1,7-bisphosphate phosphatase
MSVAKGLILLDRDGTIISLVNDNGSFRSARNISEVNFIKDSVQVTQGLKKLGYKIVIVTNQPEISRRSLTMKNLISINKYIKLHLPDIDEILFCPHDDTDNCIDRKPNIGLLLKASELMNIPAHKTWLIGDREKDIISGAKFGSKTILISSAATYSSSTLLSIKPDYEVDNLFDCLNIISKDNNSS